MVSTTFFANVPNKSIFLFVAQIFYFLVVVFVDTQYVSIGESSEIIILWSNLTTF